MRWYTSHINVFVLPTLVNESQMLCYTKIAGHQNSSVKTLESCILNGRGLSTSKRHLKWSWQSCLQDATDKMTLQTDFFFFLRHESHQRG